MLLQKERCGTARLQMQKFTGRADGKRKGEIYVDSINVVMMIKFRHHPRKQNPCMYTGTVRWHAAGIHVSYATGSFVNREEAFQIVTDLYLVYILNKIIRWRTDKGWHR